MLRVTNQGRVVILFHDRPGAKAGRKWRPSSALIRCLRSLPGKCGSCDSRERICPFLSASVVTEGRRCPFDSSAPLICVTIFNAPRMNPHSVGSNNSHLMNVQLILRSQEIHM